MNNRKKRWAVFISGRGSNLQVLLQQRDHANVALVVSDKKSAKGLLRARRSGVPAKIYTPLDWEALSKDLERFRIDCIFLAGFMRIIPEKFVSKWQGKILNVHPSLLPQYPGLESVSRAMRDRAAVGVTVHEVVKEVDAGRILFQKEVFEPGAFGSLALDQVMLRVHAQEHHLVQKAVRKWS